MFHIFILNCYRKCFCFLLNILKCLMEQDSIVFSYPFENLYNASSFLSVWTMWSIWYFQVLDFFNSRMDAQRGDGDWSVDEVLQVIIVNCRSWRGEGMKVKWNYFQSGLLWGKLLLFFTLPFLTDVYATALHIRTRESSRGVFYSICLAASLVPMVCFLWFAYS